MNKTAKNLNEIINIYGFGCEFGMEEIISVFDDADNVIESLKEEGLVEKNQLSGKYYLSDIFTCNNFLAKHLKEEEDESPKEIDKTLKYQIKKDDFIKWISGLKGFEENIKNIEVKSESDSFTVTIKILIDEKSLSEFEKRLSNYPQI